MKTEGHVSVLLKKNKRKKIWFKLVIVLASMVVFWTTYALILPAITMTENYYCGIEEHLHTEECFLVSTPKTYLCEAQPHCHNSDCYDENNVLTCGLADFFIHVHSEICYDSAERLICELPEISFHQHTQDCYLGEYRYSCGLSDSERHNHTDDCFVEEWTLVCELQEQEAHIHEDSCYESQNSLTCMEQECESHIHTDDYYLVEQVLECSSDDEEHIHDDTCYVEQTTLVCPQQETEGHIHDEYCYTLEQNLICEQAEFEHIHDEDTCYSMLQVTICNLENGEIHEHTNTCHLMSEPILVCGQYDMIWNDQDLSYLVNDDIAVHEQLIVEEHIHSDECFMFEKISEPVLICGLEEHTHELICSSDKTADLETAEIWRTTLPAEDKLTNIWSKDLLSVAKSQLGYQESTRNFEFTEEEVRQGYSRYGQWYGAPYCDWDAMYVSFCLHYAGIPQEIIPYEANCQDWVDKLTELALYYPAHEYTPKPGDIIFLGDAENHVNHVGIVSEVCDTQLNTIEGDISSCVAECSYELNDPMIMGYGSIEVAEMRGLELGLLNQEEYQVILETFLEDIQVSLTAPIQAFSKSSAHLQLDAQSLDEEYYAEMKDQLGENSKYRVIQLQVLSDEEIIYPEMPVQVRVGPFLDKLNVMTYTLTDTFLQDLESTIDADGFVTVTLTELQPIVLWSGDAVQDEKTVTLETICNDISICLSVPETVLGDGIYNWQLTATEPEGELLDELRSLAENDTYWKVADVSLMQGWNAVPDLMGGTLSFHLNNSVETDQPSLYRIVSGDATELVPVEYQVAEDGSLIVEEAESGIYAFAYTKQLESLTLETYYDNLHIVVKAPAEAFVAVDGDLVLTAVNMDAETLSYVSENVRSFQNIKGFDLQVLAGDIVVEPEAPVEILITDDGLSFSEKTDFIIYQYSEISESGTSNMTEVSGIYEDGILKVTSSCLSGFVVTYEEPYDGIQLEADYGDIHIRLLAPADAFPVTAENLVLVVQEPEEGMKERLQDTMGEEQAYFAVDIQILCDGEPIQPHGDVQVIFEMKDDPFPNADAVEVFHVVEDEENQILDMQQVEGGYDSNGDVVMETNHFSTYVLKAASAPVMLAAEGSPTNTWNEALTDRSGNVGVSTEGYTESPYTLIAESEGWMYALGQVTSNTEEAMGGTVVLKKDLQVNEEYWDGEQPFRITSADPNNPQELTMIRDDWFVEDTHAPHAALKIDNVKILSTLQKVNIWGRGNKVVIGENVWVNPNKTTRVWGGSDNSNTTTNYPTNVVVLSADWDYVCGGGRKNIPAGTTVTIGGTAKVGTLYGGGMEHSTVGTPNGENTDVNIFIEGGTVGTLYGGNLVQDRNDAIYEDINIEVSAGHVGILYAGNDYSEMEAEDAEGSFVQGTATVRLTNSGSATRVLGDPYHSALTRSIKGAAILEVYCNEQFDLMDYWDVVRITGNGSVNSTNVSTDLTTGGGYIGRMEVTNGGRLYLKQNGYINILNESDQRLTPQNIGSTPYDLKHAWQGESTEERRNLSTLAIEGAAITPSGNYYFDQKEGKAGLRIKGNVEGFSTLEACGTPMYSTGDTYYYYVVADSSDNGGKAFREPEGAPYVVCYRYLEDGRIGWYLRERPVLTMTNSLVRVGTEGTLTPTDNGFYTGCPSNYVIMHVDMKGFAYEWSSTPGKNRVDFSWTIFDGYENATAIPGGISVQTMADIEKNIYCTSNPNGIFANVEYNAMGSDEGSTEQTKRVSSFYVIIDTSKAVNPRYYDVSSSFHYTRGEDNYDDLRVGQTVDAARCTYDFDNPNNDIEDLPTDGYSDSIMTTYEYNDGIPPKGADDALLRVYLPEGVSANTLTVKELDGNFTFKETGKSASLVANAQVNQYYETEEESTYNHQFGVTLQQTGESEVDLAGGATLHSLSGKENYHCAVYSHKNIDFTDITPESELGLQLQLQLNSLTKEGNAVGIGDPSAVNDGELRIQVLPVGTIIDTTKISVEKRVTGALEGHTAEFDFLLSYPKDVNGNNVTHEEWFTLKHGEVQTFVVPVDTEITVQEIKHDGYYVQARVQGDENAPYTDTITVTPDKTPGNEDPTKVIFYNTPGAELPETGGFSTQIYTFLGLLLTLGGILFLWMHRRERRTAD